MKLAVWGFHEMQDAREHGDFEYDFHVVFTDDSQNWVRDHLRPNLEERLPDYGRNVFGDADLQPGMHYLDAILNVVENSFKTVFLLSRAAVHDNWFLVKFRLAMDYVSDAKLENIAVIFLEEIPHEDLPFLVRLYLSDRRPCLCWPEGEEDREYFWNELIKSLEVNLRFNPVIPPE